MWSNSQVRHPTSELNWMSLFFLHKDKFWPYSLLLLSWGLTFYSFMLILMNKRENTTDYITEMGDHDNSFILTNIMAQRQAVSRKKISVSNPRILFNANIFHLFMSAHKREAEACYCSILGHPYWLPEASMNDLHAYIWNNVFTSFLLLKIQKNKHISVTFVFRLSMVHWMMHVPSCVSPKDI